MLFFLRTWNLDTFSGFEPYRESVKSFIKTPADNDWGSDHPLSLESKLFPAFLFELKHFLSHGDVVLYLFEAILCISCVCVMGCSIIRTLDNANVCVVTAQHGEMCMFL